MRLSTRKFSRSEHAQALLEFALIVPLLLTIVYGLMEFGRLLAIYSMITTSSREGSRHGAAAGDIGGGIPHYADCDGIRAAAKRQAALVNLQDSDIIISYDHGPGTTVSVGCPPGYTVELGDRVIVEVTGHFEPLIPMLNIPPMTIHSKSARTILKDITVEGTLPPPIPSNTPNVSPTPTVTHTFTNTPTDTPTITPITPGVPSVTPTDTPTETPTSTPTSTPTVTNTPTPSPTPTCNIFTGNPLEIVSDEYTGEERVSWTLQNLSPDTLVLSSLYINWPMNTYNPKLDFITFSETVDPTKKIWDGNVPQSPTTVSSWSAFVSERTLSPYPGIAEITSLYFTRPLDYGTYMLELTFHDEETNTNCTVSTQRDWVSGP